MRYLVDTSVLLRFVSPNDPGRAEVLAAVAKLYAQNDELVYTPQVNRELWSVLTRPLANNGYGMTPAEAEQPIGDIDGTFEFMDDVPGTYSIWLKLVKAHAVSGRQVHDANHVATMLANGISHVFTLNARDFARYAITVVTPDAI